MDLKKQIREIPNFPIPGVSFKDIAPLLSDAEALEFIAKNLVTPEQLLEIDHFVGIESRGFILAMLLAAVHKKGFIPIRKSGKLPPPILSRSYSLEYGQAKIEMAPGNGERVFIIDDVLATGGTLQAAIDLAQEAGFLVQAVAVLINLKFLNQMRFNNSEVFSLVQYE
jgi:adenine phosphoribosyltransferase